ncbi:MAG: competence/damage-inducible protein A [Chloroflexi bacterium]|nr:competence/damage-inducible protein A [Chloroflexota bacterium]
MYAEIVSVGTELLMGEIVDTNAAYLAARLPALGLEMRWVSQVGDDLDHMVEILRRALGRSDVILTTGGLGPTQDDLTREAIAQSLGEEPLVDPELLEQLTAYFRDRSMPMPSSNTKQATLIPSARSLPNPRGTAPGWWVEKGGRIIIAMPGVPPEMERMWEKEAVPRLKERVRGTVILTRAIKTFGLSEAAVGEALHSLFGQGNPYLGIYAKSDGIHLRIIARAAREADAQALIAPVEAEIQAKMGPAIWGVDDETPEERLGSLLRERSLTLATMESCTGGLLASTITDVPGSSEYFLGGFVTYSNASKIAHGVDPRLVEEHGAVSPQVAEAMAQAARQRLETDLGVSVTGVAGPADQEGKPPGTVHIGLAWEGQAKAVSGRYPPRREMVKRRAVTHALLELCRLVAQRYRG